MVSFGALKANVMVIHGGFQLMCDITGIKFENIISMTWLPQYHDMGKKNKPRLNRSFVFL